MKCPECSHPESKVIDSRPNEDGTTIRRRRECEKCGNRFNTYEKVEDTPIIVLKKDGTSQTFNRQKILNGIITACEKRPVTLSQMEHIVDETEQDIKNKLKKEVSTKEIGEMVMEKLRKLDEVAYIRFASVYREFKDVNLFLEEINKLLKDE
ncbi:MAG: transcriptional regulator NrdR [Oscillospiraceae bacterium]|nr:transcriptional regulator NrdR [Oscillospiraceae bacterium]